MFSQKVSDILVAPLILILFYTAAMKFIDHGSFESNLHQSPWTLIANNRFWFSWALPIVEIITTFCLIISRYRLIGFVLSTLLFAAFTSYLSYFILQKIHLPCSCGGIIAYLNWRQHVLLNSILLIISIWGILVEKKIRKNYTPENNLNYTT